MHLPIQLHSRFDPCVDWSDGFAKRQFDDKTYSGTKLDFDKHEFVRKINEIYEASDKQLVDG